MVKVQIQDVARAAGVSISTVSRALRGLDGVGPRTRERVLEVASDLGYSVSPRASSFASGRTGCVAVIVPTISEWYYARVVATLVEEFRAASIEVLLLSSGTSEQREQLFATLPMRGRADGVVACLPSTEEELAALDALDVPVVHLGRRRPGLPSVGIDDTQGATFGVRHLLALGHERIALAGPRPDERDRAVRERRAGYATALAEVGIEPRAEFDVDESMSYEGGTRAMSRLLTVSPLPSAVFCMSDELAFGAMKVARGAGLRVPEDLSVVGFDNHDLADAFDLTTVAQDVDGQASAVAGCLLSLLAGEEPVEDTVVQATHLVVRGSTRPYGA